MFWSPWRAYELRRYIIAATLIMIIILWNATLVDGQARSTTTARTVSVASEVAYIELDQKLKSIPELPQIMFDFKSRCNGNGFINETDSSCTCISPYYGRFCDLKYCPYGTSWSVKPTTNHVKLQPMTECSDMGFCDPLTGVCKCREGYGGRACQRLACPGLTLLAGSTISVPCNGHGKCRTIGEAASDFNGLDLIYPIMEYTQWDADKIQGCICDHGYEGFDCSRRSCPTGTDPTDPTSTTSPKMVLECSANDGYFSLEVRGYNTAPIPYDADASSLQHALLALENVESVTVQTGEESGISKICSSTSTPLSTTITFGDIAGSMPPIRIHNATSSTREWPSATNSIDFHSGAPILRLSTDYTLICPQCIGCNSTMSFKYLDSISDAFDPIYTTAAELKSHIESLSDLSNGGWTNLAIDVTLSSGSIICSDSASVTTSIKIKSDYGNIPAVELIEDKLYNSAGDEAVSLTFTSNHGIGKRYECSRQGFCEYMTGECKCFQEFTDNSTLGSNEFRGFNYRFTSSNGFGSEGGKGDCGYRSVDMQTCNNVTCSGHGHCIASASGTTSKCDCHDGWGGITCAIKECPRGRAWFDEPILSTIAHREAECSNMGICDRASGRCICRVGWVGSACQIRDCPFDDDTGDHCSGHGWCVSSRELAAQDGIEYGDSFDDRTYPGAWDADVLKHCLCSAQTAVGYIGRKEYPSHGPIGLYSGIAAHSDPLPGWQGYDCAAFHCPAGDPTSHWYGNGGIPEIQRVACSVDPSIDADTDFTLKLFDVYSLSIGANFTARDIRLAIEASPALGNVTINFPNYGTDPGKDTISTACDENVNSTHGGFTVLFNYELGDLSPMVADNGKVTVSEFQKGTRKSQECSGPLQGFCNRRTGECLCYEGFGSSNGYYDQPGNRGDCSWYKGINNGS